MNSSWYMPNVHRDLSPIPGLFGGGRLMVPDDKSGSSVVLPLIRFQGLLAGKLEGYHSLLLFA